VTSRPTPQQRRRIDRFESVLRTAEPVLNLLLVVGERVSWLVDRRRDDYAPPRAPARSPGLQD
jgi:hypothetical protein